MNNMHLERVRAPERDNKPIHLSWNYIGDISLHTLYMAVLCLSNSEKKQESIKAYCILAFGKIVYLKETISLFICVRSTLEILSKMQPLHGCPVFWQ